MFSVFFTYHLKSAWSPLGLCIAGDADIAGHSATPWVPEEPCDSHTQPDTQKAGVTRHQPHYMSMLILFLPPNRWEMRPICACKWEELGFSKCKTKTKGTQRHNQIWAGSQEMLLRKPVQWGPASCPVWKENRPEQNKMPKLTYLGILGVFSVPCALMVWN